MKDIDVSRHIVVPKHSKLSDKEKKELLEKYSISVLDLPKIAAKDPAIRHLSVKQGDVIKIIRKSPTSGEAVYYRGVVNV